MNLPMNLPIMEVRRTGGPGPANSSPSNFLWLASRLTQLRYFATKTVGALRVVSTAGRKPFTGRCGREGDAVAEENYGQQKSLRA